jgi:hypothetical protein
VNPIAIRRESNMNPEDFHVPCDESNPFEERDPSDERNRAAERRRGGVWLLADVVPELLARYQVSDNAGDGGWVDPIVAGEPVACLE